MSVSKRQVHILVHNLDSLPIGEFQEIFVPVIEYHVQQVDESQDPDQVNAKLVKHKALYVNSHTRFHSDKEQRPA